MTKQSPIGNLACPHCGRVIAITPTECYWWHIPAPGKSEHATKGCRTIYCTGSGEPVLLEQLGELREKA